LFDRLRSIPRNPGTSLGSLTNNYYLDTRRGTRTSITDIVDSNVFEDFILTRLKRALPTYVEFLRTLKPNLLVDIVFTYSDLYPSNIIVY
jgi:hypothetical protein